MRALTRVENVEREEELLEIARHATASQLERLLRSGARFAAKAMMLSAAADDAAVRIAVRRIGPLAISHGAGNLGARWQHSKGRTLIG